MNSLSDSHPTTRRSFLRTSAALGGTAALGKFSLESRVYAAGSDVIRIGLIGCGGRGTGAAVNAMNAGKDVRLVAMADIFDERLQASRAQLQKSQARPGRRGGRPLLRRLRRLPEADRPAASMWC